MINNDAPREMKAAPYGKIAPLSANAWLAFDKATKDYLVLRQAKQGMDNAALQREWRALHACQGAGIQGFYYKQPDANWVSNQLTLTYYRNARSLLEFTQEDLSLFVHLVPELIACIRHCHQQGWVHGDIKPSNFLWIAAQQLLVLIDFGSALPIGFARHNLMAWQATPAFASQAQQQGRGVVCEQDDWDALTHWLTQLSGALSVSEYEQLMAQVIARKNTP